MAERSLLSDGRRRVVVSLEDANGAKHEAVVGLEKDRRQPLPPETTPMFFRKTTAMRDSPSLPQSDGSWGVLRWLAGMLAGRTVISRSECPDISIKGLTPSKERTNSPAFGHWSGPEGASVPVHPDEDTDAKAKAAFQWLRSIASGDSLRWLRGCAHCLHAFNSVNTPGDSLRDECITVLRELLCMPVPLHSFHETGLASALRSTVHQPSHCNQGAAVSRLASLVLQQLQSSFACHAASLLQAEAKAVHAAAYRTQPAQTARTVQPQQHMPQHTPQVAQQNLQHPNAEQTPPRMQTSPVQSPSAQTSSPQQKQQPSPAIGTPLSHLQKQQVHLQHMQQKQQTLHLATAAPQCQHASNKKRKNVVSTGQNPHESYDQLLQYQKQKQANKAQANVSAFPSMFQQTLSMPQQHTPPQQWQQQTQQNETGSNQQHSSPLVPLEQVDDEGKHSANIAHEAEQTAAFKL